MKFAIAFVLFSVFLLSGCIQFGTQAEVVYDPQINPAEFSIEIDNPYFTLTPGATFVYESQTAEDTERIVVIVTNETKTVALGVTARVVWDRVYLNGELIEDTKDWYAQHNDGTVWYFGEDTAELSGGQITSHHGAWEAGVDGAKPGIIMKANPQIGDTYRQEFFKDVAEDKADVLALNEAVTVPYGSYMGCLKTRDYTPLEPGVEAEKFYCTEVGFTTLELEGGERVELVNVTTTQDIVIETPTEELQADVTEEEAIAIALERVPGTVTNVAIEQKFGKTAYVVEIRTASGTETDVIIDIDTGEVLAVE